MVGPCSVTLLPEMTDRAVKSQGFVRDETEAGELNPCEEEQEELSFGMVIARLAACHTSQMLCGVAAV